MADPNDDSGLQNGNALIFPPLSEREAATYRLGSLEPVQPDENESFGGRFGGKRMVSWTDGNFFDGLLLAIMVPLLERLLSDDDRRQVIQFCTCLKPSRRPEATVKAVDPFSCFHCKHLHSNLKSVYESFYTELANLSKLHASGPHVQDLVSRDDYRAVRLCFI
jgi:hypothetical protein